MDRISQRSTHPEVATGRCTLLWSHWAVEDSRKESGTSQLRGPILGAPEVPKKSIGEGISCVF